MLLVIDSYSFIAFCQFITLLYFHRKLYFLGNLTLPQMHPVSKTIKLIVKCVISLESQNREIVLRKTKLNQLKRASYNNNNNNNKNKNNKNKNNINNNNNKHLFALI